VNIYEIRSGPEQMRQVDPAWFALDGYVPHQGKLKAEVAV
jgi:hypothetical protein